MLSTDDGEVYPMRLRSMVGLIPLFAVEVLEPELLDALPNFNRRLKWFLNYRPDLAALVSRWEEPGAGDRHLLSLLRGHRMKRLLARMLDESEFLSDHGVRALSKVHETQPVRVRLRRRASRGALRAGRFRQLHVRRQLQLARAGVDAGELPAGGVDAAVPPLLRRRLQDRMPRRLRAAWSPSWRPRKS